MRDVLIVGSGAGGGPLALALARAGFDVLVLEKGPRHRRADYRHDEMELRLRPDFFIPSPETEPHVLVEASRPDAPPRRSTLGWIACCVGGGTAHMGGTLYRFHPDDFRLRSRLGAFEELEDWPYGYDELEPYYVRAEWEVGVSGPADTGPFTGFRSRAFPMPPVRSHPLAARFDATCRSLGLHPFATPRAVNSRRYRGRPACAHCDFCAGFGCPTGARGSTVESLLGRARRTGRCRVLPNVMVRKITTGADGRATGCIALDASGGEHRVRARLVCICCSAVESARLLLLSRSPRFPDGVANGSGRVGRHLQLHATSSGRACFRRDRHPSAGLEDRNPFLGRSVMDHYFLPPGVSPLPKGGVLRFDMQRTYPVSEARRAAREGGALLWGEPLVRRLRERFVESREVEWESFQDFVPNRETYVELDGEVTDRWGLPVARIHLAEPEHHRASGGFLADRAREILDAMGADGTVVDDVGRTATAMAQGTCRAGADPARSVLNGFCQAHQVPNLFVVDGSFMPTSGGSPTTLTILANAFRTADYIADRARTGDLHRTLRRGAPRPSLPVRPDAPGSAP
ncbi:MAG TPA: GMC family oxidoreductase [Longimicrobium sp.]|nr:GMC family oxidoreductase [Longimicrobium sp.]